MYALTLRTYTYAYMCGKSLILIAYFSAPNSINSESIQVMITDNNDVKMTWEV